MQLVLVVMLAGGRNRVYPGVRTRATCVYFCLPTAGTGVEWRCVICVCLGSLSSVLSLALIVGSDAMCVHYFICIYLYPNTLFVIPHPGSGSNYTAHSFPFQSISPATSTNETPPPPSLKPLRIVQNALRIKLQLDRLQPGHPGAPIPGLRLRLAQRRVRIRRIRRQPRGLGPHRVDHPGHEPRDPRVERRQRVGRVSVQLPDEARVAAGVGAGGSRIGRWRERRDLGPGTPV